MKSKLLLVASLLLFGIGNAQINTWKPVDSGSLIKLEKTDRVAMPLSYHLFSTDLDVLKQTLLTAPARITGAKSTLIIPFPDGEGNIQHFRVYEASVMHAQLAARHTDMQSYVGQGIENPSATIRLSITRYGLHAMILSPQGTVYTDPFTKDLKNYIVYKKNDLKEDRSFICTVPENADNQQQSAIAERSALSNDSSLRTYRLAMACTIEYAAYHVSRAGLTNGTLQQKKDAVLAAMVVTVTRVDAVYEKEVGVTMVLVPNNEDIIFITSDSFNNNNAEVLIDQSQNVITSLIGTDSFDIGHTVSTGGGGLAGLGVICDPDQKASGITGSDAPVGDPFDIDYVAHEMGHQFGGNHTFNGTDDSCGGNNNNSTSVEPGSGTTIMAYAGICGAANIQTNSDDYFNTVSLDEIFAVLRATDCAEILQIANTAPTVPSLTSKTIPKGTAFVLRGTVATDAEGDALTYTWEQTNGVNTNAQHTNTPSSTSTTGPLYRSLPPTTSRDRYMPEFAEVLANNLATTWEVTPTVGRSMAFAYTVRDNNALGGQTTRRNIAVTVSGTAGPFLVTSQNQASVVWPVASQQTITWDVAGTATGNVNTPNVNILLSTDDGLTFNTVLAANTPNDGTETITVPNVLAPYCRIKIEAVNNLFYALNTTPFSVGYTITTACNTYTNDTDIAIPDNVPTFTTSGITVAEGSSVTSVKVNVNITHTAVGNLVLKAINPNNTEVVLWNQRCTTNDDINITFSDDGANVVCVSTELGNTYKPLQPLSAFSGTNPVGNWTFAIADLAATNTGTLNSWALTICAETYTPLAAAQYSLKDFTLYPNPNTGSFTVQFESQSQNNINISVHDIMGRQVFNNSFANTGTFSHNLSLQNVQGGIYMVTVQDGNRKEVRKVVVK